MSEIRNWRPKVKRTNNFELNRIHNCKNEHQGKAKKVLCCCSAGLLRSPTAMIVLSQDPFNFNTRAVGLEESYALIPIDRALAYWADEIVVMTRRHAMTAQILLDEWELSRPIKTLNIPDEFARMDPVLVKMIKDNYLALEGGK